MSALTVPPAPAAAQRDHATRPLRTTPPQRRHLRVVEDPTPGLAPTGPLQAWRRRLAVLVLLALVVTAVVAMVGGTPVPAEPVPAATDTATAVVEPGQTLWDVAVQHAPVDVSTDAYVRQLAELNGITNGAVDAWRVLRLPTS